jgi:hypothetical protein
MRRLSWLRILKRFRIRINKIGILIKYLKKMINNIFNNFNTIYFLFLD